MSNPVSSFENNMLTGVFVYACIRDAVENYDKTAKEWKIGVVVDEDTSDSWDEVFPKQPAKVVRSDQFEDIYKIKPPFEGKKQYVITVRKDELLGNGAPVPEQYRPKVFIENSKGKNVDITASKLVGNGSEGMVSIEVYENKYGTFARLRNVKVTNLIEYRPTINDPAGSEFGEVDNSGDEFDQSVDNEVVKETKVKASSKPSRKVKSNDVIDTDDDDAPF